MTGYRNLTNRSNRTIIGPDPKGMPRSSGIRRRSLFRELVISGQKANVLNARIEVLREVEY